MDNSYLAHHGVLGMKWGVRRYQNKDGSLTNAGRKRYLNDNGWFTKEGRKNFNNDVSEGIKDFNNNYPQPKNATEKKKYKSDYNNFRLSEHDLKILARGQDKLKYRYKDYEFLAKTSGKGYKVIVNKYGDMDVQDIASNKNIREGYMLCKTLEDVYGNVKVSDLKKNFW